MFKDVDLSRDIMRGFAADEVRSGGRVPEGVEMFVNILTAGYWQEHMVYSRNAFRAQLKARPRGNACFFIGGERRKKNRRE